MGLCSYVLFFFLHPPKEFLRQNRKAQREQLATLILCRSSDSFLLHKQCRSELRRLWRGVERPDNQAEPSALSPCDCSTLRHVHAIPGKDHFWSLQNGHASQFDILHCFFSFFSSFLFAYSTLHVK